MDDLAEVLCAVGRVDEALARMRNAATMTHGEELPDLLARLHRIDDLRACAAARRPGAAVSLARLLFGLGRADEAMEVWRAHLAVTHDSAQPDELGYHSDDSSTLGALFARHGWVAWAEEIWRADADLGCWHCRARLLGMLFEQGRVDEAVGVWRVHPRELPGAPPSEHCRAADGVRRCGPVRTGRARR
ncbi:hypothetical protein ACQPWW_09870 [Micromonospora sp. CA-240977]|uniref:hypothetical protein n=1 Tax=Micromonospora sp. CA-240977 TaxID=3239957 RepID=UPI003D90D220